ncbi:MAG: ATP-binding protein [Robiginitomaculum sp.]
MSVLVVSIVLISLLFSGTIKIMFYKYFHKYWYDNLPLEVRMQLDTTQKQCVAISESIPDIYQTYWGSGYESFQNGILLLINFTVILIGLLAAVFFSKKLSRPISQVAKAARGVTRGNLGARADTIPKISGNEIGLLVSNFNSMAESLERRERERQKSMAAIAHELRTPLTILKGRLQGITDGVYSSDIGEIQQLIGQTDLLSRIVDDVRILSLAEVGKLSLKVRDVALSEIVASVVESMEPKCKAAGIKLVLDIQTAPMKGDMARLTQIFYNLLENAIRYGASGKWIKVQVGSNQESVFVIIQDRGQGLPEDVDSLFNYFERGEVSRSRGTGGSGLGLAVVKSLVEAHNGSVRARNWSSGGAEFMVIFPK